MACASDEARSANARTGQHQPNIRGQDKNQRTLVDIKLENGKHTTVDFGPADSLEKIDLEEGDGITVPAAATRHG